MSSRQDGLEAPTPKNDQIQLNKEISGADFGLLWVGVVYGWGSIGLDQRESVGALIGQPCPP